MFDFLKRRPLIGSDAADFVFDCFAWLLRNTRGFEHTVLVQPTDRFFPHRRLRGRDLAVALFERVRKHADMSEWPCRLESQSPDPNPLVAPTVVVRGAPHSPAGSFSAREDGVVITYDPAAVADPMTLVATFAHELAHYRTAGFREPPPGGWDQWEFATDVASVFMGFGLFAANSCFQFSQFTAGATIGWSTRRLGYLSEPELVFAQAVFSALKAIPREEVLAHLKPALRGSFKRACREVAARRDRLDMLREARP